jgi:flagellar motor switch protein FliN/FliY
MNDLVVAPIELEEAEESVGLGTALVHRDLSLLGHVNVKLDVHLGNAEVSVDRLFSLAKGETLVLDASLDAPVTLRLDGKPIARGHLLAVGEHFGLKVTEIL